MKDDIFCPNRIKPQLLREQKTEALLIFIRTILEESFDDDELLTIYSHEDAAFIRQTMVILLSKLKDHVVNATYLQYVKNNAKKSKLHYSLAVREEPVTTYYNSLSNTIVNTITKGQTWLPELIIVSLLSHWILEEEKSIYLYPFLNDIDYTNIISRFDQARIDSKQMDKDRYILEKEVMANMHNIALKLIEKLKQTKYKTNNYKKKSRRKR